MVENIRQFLAKVKTTNWVNNKKPYKYKILFISDVN